MADADGADTDSYLRRDFFTGDVILRLTPVAARRVNDDLSAGRSDELLAPVLALLDEFGVKERRPAVRRVKRDQILEWERRAAKSPFPPLHSLTAYWRLGLGEQRRRMPELVER